VDGTNVGSCLGDLYSVNWMENSDAVGQFETLDVQFQYTRNKTDLSHVMMYGDNSFDSDPIGNFQGNLLNAKHKRHSPLLPKHVAPKASSTIDSRDIELHNAYARYTHANGVEQSTVASQRLSKILAVRQNTDSFFTALAATSSKTLSDLTTAPTPKSILACDACCKSVEHSIRKHCNGLSDYGLKYWSVVTNMCAAGHQSHETIHTLTSTVKQLCEVNEYDLANVPLV